MQGKARSLKAGEYEVPQGANSFAVLSLLEGGKVLKHTVLLREGFTLLVFAADGDIPDDAVGAVRFLRSLPIDLAAGLPLARWTPLAVPLTSSPRPRGLVPSGATSSTRGCATARSFSKCSSVAKGVACAATDSWLADPDVRRGAGGLTDDGPATSEPPAGSENN